MRLSSLRVTVPTDRGSTGLAVVGEEPSGRGRRRITAPVRASGSTDELPKSVQSGLGRRRASARRWATKSRRFGADDVDGEREIERDAEDDVGVGVVEFPVVDVDVDEDGIRETDALARDIDGAVENRDALERLTVSMPRVRSVDDLVADCCRRLAGVELVTVGRLVRRANPDQVKVDAAPNAATGFTEASGANNDLATKAGAVTEPVPGGPSRSPPCGRPGLVERRGRGARDEERLTGAGLRPGCVRVRAARGVRRVTFETALGPWASLRTGVRRTGWRRRAMALGPVPLPMRDRPAA